MNIKSLTAAAFAGLAMAACKTPGAPPPGGSTSEPAPVTAATKGECWGINACKGQGACGGEGHECAGQNECKGKGWLSLSKSDCEGRGGKFKG